MKPGDKYTLIHITENSFNKEVEILRLFDYEDSDSYYPCVEYRGSESSHVMDDTEWRLMDTTTFLDLYEAVPVSETHYYRDTRNGNVARVETEEFPKKLAFFENSPYYERVYICTADQLGII